MDPADLERLVDRELRQLPLPRAPHTLLPRVMAAAEARMGAPWYRRAWRTWPIGWRLASAAACAAVVVAAGAALPLQLLGKAAGVAAASDTVRDAAALAGRIEAATNAVWVLWRVLVQPLVPFAFALAMLMCLACAAFGLALNYVAFGRTLHR